MVTLIQLFFTKFAVSSESSLREFFRSDLKVIYMINIPVSIKKRSGT